MRKKTVISTVLLLLVIVFAGLAVFSSCGASAGPPKLDYAVSAKRQVITSIYKAYGLPQAELWLSKTKLTNTGTGPMFDLKLSYKVAEYIDWISTNPYPKLVPGETVVDAFYPSFPPSVAEITTRRPVNLQVKVQYEDAKGKVFEDSRTVSMEMLGKNEFVSSNIKPEEIMSWYDANSNQPFFSAFVTPQDPPLRAFADVANKAAGGVGASLSDENALKVIEASYTTMDDYGITYKTPTFAIWGDQVGVQHIQYPRDTIEEKSGTCVDLAVLLSSMTEALGLKSYVFTLPGHAIPVVELPGGSLIAVESTYVGTEKTFDDAVAKAKEEISDAQKDGRFRLVDVQEWRGKGVLNPELPSNAALVDEIKKWAAAKAAQAAQPAQPGQGGQQGQPAQPAAQWATYKEPNGLFTMSYPQGWTVQPSQGLVVQIVNPQEPGVGLAVSSSQEAATLQQGAQGLWAVVQQLLKGAVPDLKVDTPQQIQIGGADALVVTVKGTHPTTGEYTAGIELVVVSPSRRTGLWFDFGAPMDVATQYTNTFTQMITSMTLGAP